MGGYNRGEEKYKKGSIHIKGNWSIYIFSRTAATTPYTALCRMQSPPEIMKGTDTQPQKRQPNFFMDIKKKILVLIGRLVWQTLRIPQLVHTHFNSVSVCVLKKWLSLWLEGTERQHQPIPITLTFLTFCSAVSAEHTPKKERNKNSIWYFVPGPRTTFLCNLFTRFSNFLPFKKRNKFEISVFYLCACWQLICEVDREWAWQLSTARPTASP